MRTLCRRVLPAAQLPRLADVLGPREWDGEMRAAVVHAACAATFVANGFEIVDPDPDEALGVELYCPHYKWDAAADEWALQRPEENTQCHRPR
jgi:hypothetical protein